MVGKMEEKNKREKEATEQKKKKDQLEKIARFHCKWNVYDASYITVENAMMEALRVCLGKEFTSTFEVRLRFKYGCVKNMIIDAQKSFETNFPKESLELRNEGQRRLQELYYEKSSELRSKRAMYN